MSGFKQFLLRGNVADPDSRLCDRCPLWCGGDRARERPNNTVHHLFDQI